MKAVIIIGASGHGKVIADIIKKSKDEIFGFLDDNLDIGKEFMGFPVLGAISNYKKYIDKAEFIIAIGNAYIRKRISEQLIEAKWYTAIHPTAVISEFDVTIEEGTVIMANAVINAGAKIGKHCIINSSAVVEHDNFIENYSHISVGAKLAGTVFIGELSWIGIGACVSNNIRICKRCMIGAGAVVINDIEESGTYVGVPVKKIKGECE